MKINATREIKDIKSELFFGLSARQLGFSAVGIILTVIVWLKLYLMGVPTFLILCICTVIVVPFGFLAFFRYHGMYTEQLLPALFRSRRVLDRIFYFKPENSAKILIHEYIRQSEKERRKKKLGDDDHASE